MNTKHPMLDNIPSSNNLFVLEMPSSSIRFILCILFACLQLHHYHAVNADEENEPNFAEIVYALPVELQQLVINSMQPNDAWSFRSTCNSARELVNSLSERADFWSTIMNTMTKTRKKAYLFPLPFWVSHVVQNHWQNAKLTYGCHVNAIKPARFTGEIPLMDELRDASSWFVTVNVKADTHVEKRKKRQRVDSTTSGLFTLIGSNHTELMMGPEQQQFKLDYDIMDVLMPDASETLLIKINRRPKVGHNLLSIFKSASASGDNKDILTMELYRFIADSKGEFADLEKLHAQEHIIPHSFTLDSVFMGDDRYPAQLANIRMGTLRNTGRTTFFQGLVSRKLSTFLKQYDLSYHHPSELYKHCVMDLATRLEQRSPSMYNISKNTLKINPTFPKLNHTPGVTYYKDFFTYPLWQPSQPTRLKRLKTDVNVWIERHSPGIVNDVIECLSAAMMANACATLSGWTMFE